MKNVHTKTKDRLHLGFINYMLLLAAVVVLTIGYLVMNTGDSVISPILLTIAYVILIPLSLLLKPNYPKQETPKEEQ